MRQEPPPGGHAPTTTQRPPAGHRARTPSTPRLTTRRLVLDPLRVEDGDELAVVLADPALYTVTGGEPATAAALRDRFRRLLAGPGDSDEQWHNWTVRVRNGGRAGHGVDVLPVDDQPGLAVGTVQATAAPGAGVADLAWVTGTPWQGRGYATEAAAAVVDWLLAHGFTALRAHVRADHAASERVAGRIGLHATGALDDEGEQLWELRVG